MGSINTSGDPDDLKQQMVIACGVLEKIMQESPAEIQIYQMADNIQWIWCQENKLVVGSHMNFIC